MLLYKYKYSNLQRSSTVTGLALLIFLFCSSVSKAQNELDVITGKWLEYTDATNSLYRHLSHQAIQKLEERYGETAGFSSQEDWQKWQQSVRARFLEITGPFPEKTPLNARVTHVIKKDTYRIEHVIYESQPGFYVTSSLFIPSSLKRGKKAPAIIYCSGHAAEGYRSPVYQHVMINLVRKGFIVFAFDPVGQGERLEYPDSTYGKSLLGGPTMEHSYPGAQAFMTGSSQARYMIWDGIRAVDYLLTRKEVDPARIGITGRSGGGTQSAQIAAFDDRIFAAAPENFITNYRRLFETMGPQDAEQNLYNMIGAGLDHPDYLIVRAPKPALMITTTDDIFSIQGAMETEKEVSRAYAAFGSSENFSRVEDNAAHASTLKNRMSMYAFFMKHLDNPGDTSDLETELLTPDELRVTPTGQLSSSLRGETVFSLNRKEAEKKAAMPVDLKDVQSKAARLSGYSEPGEKAEPVYSGRIVRKGYLVERYFIKGEGDCVIPYLLFKPGRNDGRFAIYLNPSGKAAEAAPGGEIEKMVLDGITVVAPDMIGTGEIGPGTFQGDAYFDGVSHNLWYAAILNGRSIAGIQAGDLVRLARMMKDSYGSQEIIGIALKDLSPALLHAAAFEKCFSSIVLIEPYSSYYEIETTRLYDPHLIPGTVAGAAGNYDLPALASSIAPVRLIVAGLTGADGKPLKDSIDEKLKMIQDTYRMKNAGDNFRIIGTGSDYVESVLDLLR